MGWRGRKEVLDLLLEEVPLVEDLMRQDLLFQTGQLKDISSEDHKDLSMDLKWEGLQVVNLEGQLGLSMVDHKDLRLEGHRVLNMKDHRDLSSEGHQDLHRMVGHQDLIVEDQQYLSSEG